MGHSLSVSDFVCHVPLIVSYPGQREKERINGLVQTHDLFKTTLEAIGMASESSVQKREDCQVLPRSDSDDTRSYAVSEYLGSPFQGIQGVMEEYPDVDYSQYDFELKTIYDDDDHKYTIKSTDEQSLQDLRERTDLPIETNRDLVAELEAELFDRVAEFDQSEQPNHDTGIETTLKDLGYI
jgi:arylsulfatase A-like enzyme